MATGLILLAFLGIIVAFGWTRLRGKMKLSVSGTTWIGAFVVFVVVVLVMYASHGGH